MKINCPQIVFVLDFLKVNGNEIAEVSDGWSNVKEDIRMKLELSSSAKEKIKLEQPDLEYWSYRGSPHNSPDEGFICHEHNVSISFPVKNKSV
ncbi:MAG: hypothetical protein UR27_C0004G0002 [Candidatus Peregrinibacteria bacterium GW2011_GWA2_33_10]|nr:MAG: hypothetical protein UR27_C0004G0002 [Candidatus Peregrinibacteria bacterium GW2011_GWA2_33_10]OGT26078.1 MAG: hypothetical protein A3B71_04255 [Gammaproteobacteria bacterium RIFCSPHIGHO2_02_FULL_42_43]